MCREKLLLVILDVVIVVIHLNSFRRSMGAECDLLQCNSAFGFLRVDKSLSGCVARRSKLSPEAAVSYPE